MSKIRPRSKAADGLTAAQQSALIKLAEAEDGIDSSCHYQPKGSCTYKKMDVRTVVSLVARGMLAGNNGRIYTTKAGADLARLLQT